MLRDDLQYALKLAARYRRLYERLSGSVCGYVPEGDFRNGSVSGYDPVEREYFWGTPFVPCNRPDASTLRAMAVIVRECRRGICLEDWLTAGLGRVEAVERAVEQLEIEVANG